MAAYLQSVSNEKVRLELEASDEPAFGMKLFLKSFDARANTLISDMIRDKALLIGFRRRTKDAEVRALLDLTVADSALDNGEMRRVVTPSEVEQFESCIAAIEGRSKPWWFR